jgi:hypothetical protein
VLVPRCAMPAQALRASVVVKILHRHDSEQLAQASTAASPGATTAIKPTDESANEHVDGQRRSDFMTKFDKGSKSSCAVGELR